MQALQSINSQKGGTPGEDAVGVQAQDVLLRWVQLLFKVHLQIHPAEKQACQSFGTGERPAKAQWAGCTSRADCVGLES